MAGVRLAQKASCCMYLYNMYFGFHCVRVVLEIAGDSWENNYDNNFAVACASASNDVAGLEVPSPEEETAEPAEPQTKLEEEVS